MEEGDRKVLTVVKKMSTKNAVDDDPQQVIEEMRSTHCLEVGIIKLKPLRSFKRLKNTFLKLTVIAVLVSIELLIEVTILF